MRGSNQEWSPERCVSAFGRYASPRALLTYWANQVDPSGFLMAFFRRHPEMADLSERFLWLVGDRMPTGIPIFFEDGPRLAASSLVAAITYVDRGELPGLPEHSEVQTLFATGLMSMSWVATSTVDVTVDGEPWCLMTGQPMGLVLASGAVVRNHKRTIPFHRHLTLGSPLERLGFLQRMYRIFPVSSSDRLDVDLRTVLLDPPELAELVRSRAEEPYET